MKIVDALRKEAILMDLKAEGKKGAIEEMFEPLVPISGVDRGDLVRVLMERERLGSTGIGGGVGIPHGKFQGLESLILGFALSRKGVDFESMDGRPTHLFFLLVTPENSTGLHLKMLARISKILKKDTLKERLMNAADPNEVVSIIQAEDEDI